MKQLTKYDIVLIIMILASLTLGGIIGDANAKENLSTCEEPRQVISMRGHPDSFFVYECADGEYRTYKKPLDNQIEGDGIDEHERTE